MINFLKQEFEQFVTFARVEWQKVLTYRVSVFTYRLAEIAETTIMVSMWLFIYAQGATIIKGYDVNEMITYVLVGSLCSVITRNLIYGSISRSIERGDLSLFLVRPISYIKYNVYGEFGAVLLTMFAAILSQLCVMFFFFDKIIFNTDPVYLLLILGMLFLAFFIEILIGLLVGIMAFWTDGEVGGFHQLASVLRKFFAGAFFPLSLLPASLAFAGYYLPFAYSFFVPAQLYLKKIDLAMGLKGIGIQLVWIIILSVIVRIVWKRGLKKYEAVGS